MPVLPPWEDVWAGSAVTQLALRGTIAWVGFVEQQFLDFNGVFASPSTLSWHSRKDVDFLKLVLALQHWSNLVDARAMCDVGSVQITCNPTRKRVRSCAGVMQRVCSVKLPRNCSKSYIDLFPLRDAIECRGWNRTSSTLGVGPDVRSAGPPDCYLRGQSSQLMHSSLQALANESSHARAML